MSLRFVSLGEGPESCVSAGSHVWVSEPLPHPFAVAVRPAWLQATRKRPRFSMCPFMLGALWLPGDIPNFLETTLFLSLPGSDGLCLFVGPSCCGSCSPVSGKWGAPC